MERHWDGEREAGREGGKGSLLSCCVVPRACEGAAPPCLTDILPPSPQRSEPAPACLQEVSSQLTHTDAPIFEMLTPTPPARQYKSIK